MAKLPAEAVKVGGSAMGSFSATDAALTGFQVVRRHPRAVAVWALVLLAISVLIGLPARMFLGPILLQAQAMSQQSPRDPAQAMAVLHQLAPLYLVGFIFILIFYPVLMGTMNRAVLRPADDRFGYLRLGADELRLLGLLLLFILVWIGIEIVTVILGVIIAVVLGLVFKGAPALISFLVFAAVFCAWVFVLVRLSLAWPLTFATRRINLFGSWTLTRGRFWPMLGSYLLASALSIVAAILGYMVIFAVAAAVGGGLGGIAALTHPDMSVSGLFAPPQLVNLVLSAGLSALLWPLFLTPPAAIYRSLAVDPAAVV